MKQFLLIAGTFLLLSCVSIERNNPDDPKSDNYGRKSSSSGGGILGAPVTYQGETYQTVVIGTQTWFKRNLNYAASGSRCYEDNPDNCKIYGRLYNWETATNVCPDGWHLPSDYDWNTLMKFLDPYCFDNKPCSVGGFLKATSGWDVYDNNGTDDYGFSALPGGYAQAHYLDGYFLGFEEIGKQGMLWSSSEEYDPAYPTWHPSDASYREIGGVVYRKCHKNCLVSVRCMKY